MIINTILSLVLVGVNIHTAKYPSLGCIDASIYGSVCNYRQQGNENDIIAAGKSNHYRQAGF